MVYDAAEQSPATFVAQRRLCKLPTLAFGTDQVLNRHLDVSQENFVELGVASDLLEWPHLHPRRVHIQNEVRDAFVLGHIWIGPCQEYAKVRQMRLTCPHFLAIDDVVI